MTLVACGDERRGTRGGGGGGRGAGWVAMGLATALLSAAPAVAHEQEGEEDGERELPAVLSEGGDGLAGAELVGLALSGADQPLLPGEEFEYRATVANGGAAPVEDGLLAQHMPEPLEVVEIADSGLVEEGVANWRVGVPEGEESVYAVRVRVSEDAEPGERLVSTACLLLDRNAQPAACASDTLQIADQTVLSRVGAMIDRQGLVRAVGVGALMVLVWLLWRQWSVTKRS